MFKMTVVLLLMIIAIELGLIGMTLNSHPAFAGPGTLDVRIVDGNPVQLWPVEVRVVR